MGFLAEMVARRSHRMAEEYGSLSPSDRERLACCARPPRPFASALRTREDVGLIAEVKKSSPSQGAIAPECEASKQALHYERGGAAAISVLVEPEVFGGAWSDLSDVADAVSVPVLAKDFVVDPVQLFAARGHGADAVLLMVSVLGREVASYLDLAATLGLEGLVEVHDLEELAIAAEAGAELVGVNSRDLSTLEIDHARAHHVARAAHDGGLVVVAESGVERRSDIEAVSMAGADAVLVGTALMRAPYPEEAVAEFIGVPKTRLGEM
ncbi:MAG: indole-3-glycerol phosphate synthase TrpC [Coriobacteriales bacterium]|nr:indole-3-glycerol phosphate synthase TrpC [Actinomycetes bacterium]